jgi:hypothetical protein
MARTDKKDYIENLTEEAAGRNYLKTLDKINNGLKKKPTSDQSMSGTHRYTSMSLIWRRQLTASTGSPY